VLSTKEAIFSGENALSPFSKEMCCTLGALLQPPELRLLGSITLAIRILPLELSCSVLATRACALSSSLQKFSLSRTEEESI
jgi:hypothetical protein